MNQTSPGDVPVWKRKSDAFLYVTGDRRLPHGAVRVFVWLAERTFWRRMGGDTLGSIIVSRNTLAKELGADKTRVSKWIRALAGLGYLVIRKIARPGRYPLNRYTVPAIAPADFDQVEFDLDPEPSPFMPAKPSFVAGDAPRNVRVADATLSKVVSANVSEPCRQPSAGMQTRSLGKGMEADRGEGSSPPGDFEVWKRRNGRLYPREVESKLLLLKADLKAERANVQNYKLVLKPDVKETLRFLEKRLKELKPIDEKSRRLISDYRRRSRETVADQQSYSRDTLSAHGAAIIANLTRKIRHLEELLR